MQRQNAIRADFKRGDLNVLFATSIGSEGLDFRQCQLVLAFDRPYNVVTLVQVAVVLWYSGSGGPKGSVHALLATSLGSESMGRARWCAGVRSPRQC